MEKWIVPNFKKFWLKGLQKQKLLQTFLQVQKGGPMCQKFESTYFLLKFPFLMKSYPTDSIFSPIGWCFDVAQSSFFSAILKKKI